MLDIINNNNTEVNFNFYYKHYKQGIKIVIPCHSLWCKNSVDYDLVNRI